MIIDGVVTNSNIISECNRLSISMSPSEEHATSSTEIGTKYRVGYNIAMQVAGIRNPPWVECLAEVSINVFRKDRFGALPLLVSAFENHLYGRLNHTLREKGGKL